MLSVRISVRVIVMCSVLGVSIRVSIMCSVLGVSVMCSVSDAQC